jgi:hypothetical protein
MQQFNKQHKATPSLALTLSGRCRVYCTSVIALLTKRVYAVSMAKKTDKKVTNEKPVSLSPLKFKEALKGLLATTPAKSADQEKPQQNQAES